MLTNRSMPRGHVIPELGYADVGHAVEWLCETFGFSLRLQIANHRAQLNVGDGAIVVTERRMAPDAALLTAVEGGRGGDHAVMVRVEDVDHHFEHANHRGARILNPPTTYPYGERQYTVEDLGGHRWTFSQSVADIDPASWGGTPGRL